MWASLGVIRVIKSRKEKWMGVTAFSGLDEKSIKYLHRKIGADAYEHCNEVSVATRKENLLYN